MVQKKNGLEPDNIPLNWYFVRVFVLFVGEKYREIKGWNCDRSIEDCLILIWSCNMFFVVPSPYIREGREIVSPHLINQPFKQFSTVYSTISTKTFLSKKISNITYFHFLNPSNFTFFLFIMIKPLLNYLEGLNLLPF